LKDLKAGDELFSHYENDWGDEGGAGIHDFLD
jgi:hypothetical protein